MFTTYKFFHLTIRLAAFLLLSAAIVQAQTRNESAVSYLERGASWLEKGEYDRAIADFNIVLVFAPHMGSAYFSRGCAREARGDLKDKGDLDDAIADHSRAIALNPRFAQAYSGFQMREMWGQVPNLP
ncbi:MAG: hypothetical protein L0287_37470, partial [Anaerolineae bacterium]|nr:hypothetical protein [Anaerolineae bacterium]